MLKCFLKSKNLIVSLIIKNQSEIILNFHLKSTLYFGLFGTVRNQTIRQEYSISVKINNGHFLYVLLLASNSIMPKKKSKKKKLRDDVLRCPHCKKQIILDSNQLKLLNSELIQDVTIKCPSCGNLYNMNQINEKLGDDVSRCPHCKNQIILDSDQLKLLNSELIQDVTIKCPSCGNLYNINQTNEKMSNGSKFKITKKIKQVTGILNNLFFKNPPFITAIFIGIILIISGLILLYLSLIQNLKSGITLIGIGSLCFFLISEKKRLENALTLSEKITVIISIWMCISFLLTYNAYLNVFFLINFIGFLIIKVLLKAYIPENIDLKLKIIMLVFFAIYMMLIINTFITYFT